MTARRARGSSMAETPADLHKHPVRDKRLIETAAQQFKKAKATTGAGGHCGKSARAP